VTVRHVIGAVSTQPLLIEERDIVYCTISQTAKPIYNQEGSASWSRSILPDEVMLFRYSALTFNSHRIHYDHEYATQKEGYPGLVVQGPLVATMLLDLVSRNLPKVGIIAFDFRSLAPLFVHQQIELQGTPGEDGKSIRLWATDHNNILAMQATAMVTSS
jgi:3-methylfumaryl-CoA hydratase